MNVYLDESYNLQRNRGKVFISINGFAVLNDKLLRKRWKQVRKKFVGKRRIHATDSSFVGLRAKSIKLLGSHDVAVLSVFQLIQELPAPEYFTTEGCDFEKVYIALIQSLLLKLSLNEYRRIRVLIDARSHTGGKLGGKKFQIAIEEFLGKKFEGNFVFKRVPSSMDVLVELADFVSNIFYRAYQAGQTDIFTELGFKLIQIKNPL